MSAGFRARPPTFLKLASFYWRRIDATEEAEMIESRTPSTCESRTPSTWRWTVLCGTIAIAAVAFIDSGLNGPDQPVSIAFGDRGVCKQAALQEAREQKTPGIDPRALPSTMSEAEADIVVQYCSPDGSEAPE